MALEATDSIARPVDLVRLLVAHGISLKKAHAVLSRIAAGERVCVRLLADDIHTLAARFAALGIRAGPIERPKVDVSGIRHGLRLSQEEFALRFAFEPGTLRNWEQGRNEPDSAVAVLLKLIELRPDLVDGVLSGSIESERAATG